MNNETKEPPPGGFFVVCNAQSARYVLTYINPMLRHINLKYLCMSRLLCNFAVEIREKRCSTWNT